MPILGIMASQISGHLWAPAGAYDALATVTVPSGGAASITFAGIPTGYKHLQLRQIARGDAAGNNYSQIVSFNSDTTTANYRSHYLYGDGSGVAAGTYQSTGGVYLTTNTAGAGAGTNVFATSVTDILDYSNVNKNKTTRSLHGQDRNGAGVIEFDSGVWFNTSAITSISITINGANFAQYSQIALYGVK
jgi:hypothetical protein